jgi:hypothetical protein
MVSSRALDEAASQSYFDLIPIHRYPGGAFVRASAFRLEAGVSSVEMGHPPCGAEEG